MDVGALCYSQNCCSILTNIIARRESSLWRYIRILLWSTQEFLAYRQVNYYEKYSGKIIVLTADPNQLCEFRKRKPIWTTSHLNSFQDFYFYFFHLSNLNCVGTSCGLRHRWLLTVHVMRWKDIGLVSSQGETAVATLEVSYSMNMVQLQEWLVSIFKDVMLRLKIWRWNVSFMWQWEKKETNSGFLFHLWRPSVKLARTPHGSTRLHLNFTCLFFMITEQHC